MKIAKITNPATNSILEMRYHNAAADEVLMFQNGVRTSRIPTFAQADAAIEKAIAAGMPVVIEEA